MRWTIRGKLAVIVLSTAVLQAILVAVDLEQERRERASLAAIERDYLPLIDLGNDAQRRFTDLTRKLEDAASAQDLAAVEATRGDEAALIAELGHAPPIVPRDALLALDQAIDRWYLAATDVSRRLIRGESGLELTADIARMQAFQRQAQAGIQSTVVLDRGKLSSAFREVRRLISEAWLLRMLIRIGLVVLVLLLAVGLALQIVRSLGALAAGFERFGRGEFVTAVEVRGDDELSEVARLANRMAANLEDLNRKLQARQAELERVNHEIEAFNYSVSHDLRAPLRAIDGFSAAVVEDYAQALPPKGQDYLHRVRAAAQHMAELIDDILRLSRVTRAELRRSRVDVTEMARSIGEELARAAPERTVQLDVAPGLTVFADARMLRIALENLLSNAWKFTSKAARPRIEVGQRPEGPGFFVKDNGAGFDMAYVDKLFTPFSRLHTTDEFPGTGIGLATVQRIIHRHGGQVSARAAVDRGATFFVELPGDDKEG